MEPNLATAPHLLVVLDELKKREPIFHRTELGTSREALEKMIAEDFWEVGASGTRYSREFVIETLLERYKQPSPDIWQTKEFHCQEIAKDNYLLNYTLIQDNKRVTRRTTMWRNTDEGWKIVYHQGTIVRD